MQFWARPLINNVLVALAAAAATRAAQIELGLRSSAWSAPCALVFFATLLVYSLDRAIPAPEDRPVERGHSAVLWAGCGVGAAGAVAAALHLPARALWLLAPLAWLSLAYSAPLWPLRRRLKAVPGAKLPIIALVWAGAIVALPWLAAPGRAGAPEVAALAVERALMIGALTWPFEIRDAARDRDAGLAGPGDERRGRARALLALALAVLLALARALAWDAPAWPAILSYAAMALLVVPGTRPRHPAYYAALDASIAAPWALGVLL